MNIAVLDIGAIIGYLAGLTVIVKAILDWRQAKPDIAKKYEQMCIDQAKRNDELRTELDEKDKNYHSALAEIRTKLDNELAAANEYIDELLEGIKVLLDQLIEIQQVPRWRPRRRADKLAEKKAAIDNTADNAG